MITRSRLYVQYNSFSPPTARQRLVSVVHVLGRDTVLSPLDAANVSSDSSIRPKDCHGATHFCLPQALILMDEMSMKPEVAVGSKPPISSMDENLASYRPSSESRPSTMTLPL